MPSSIYYCINRIVTRKPPKFFCLTRTVWLTLFSSCQWLSVASSSLLWYTWFASEHYRWCYVRFILASEWYRLALRSLWIMVCELLVPLFLKIFTAVPVLTHFDVLSALRRSTCYNCNLGNIFNHRRFDRSVWRDSSGNLKIFQITFHVALISATWERKCADACPIAITPGVLNRLYVSKHARHMGTNAKNGVSYLHLLSWECVLNDGIGRALLDSLLPSVKPRSYA